MHDEDVVVGLLVVVVGRSVDVVSMAEVVLVKLLLVEVEVKVEVEAETELLEDEPEATKHALRSGRGDGSASGDR
jgi:hypothetical protein